MKAQKAFGIASAMVLLVASTYGQAFSPYYSVVNGGPSGYAGDDVLGAPSPPVNPVPASIFLQGSVLGYEVDAISGNQHYGEEWVFSVDITSVGLPGTAVNLEAAGGDQPADIYVGGFGLNNLTWDGNGLPNPLTGGTLGLLEPGSVPGGDDIDGLEVHGFADNAVTQPLGQGAIYYSLSQASAGGIGFDGATLFMSSAVNNYDVAPFMPYATAGMLGLLAGGQDDIDAAVVYDNDLDGMWSAGDVVDFSLTPGSATLAGMGASAADVLRTGFGSGPVVFVSAGALGLLTTDNLDALDMIPEPSTIALIGISALGLLIRKRLMPY
ncbi:PEP-CTERM sorting domain-containing protein [Pontiella sulfatireligans]|uniref:Ice-binding protein C-terminal domain-containing protein n=1 Tax=Pontiella sulfatireligans TaxID=2750658 RepID=A0A6C2UNH7_9BACT|nr:PEP-CTERM sorting domain-containing protein [Pontiella sulfatireligans]VGO21830.1 hypothetical protein SCARR_03907 [Pontiella sulfatireligans]